VDDIHLLVVYAALFVGVLLLSEGVYHLIAGLRRTPEAIINRRLRMLASGVDPEEVLKLLRRPLGRKGLAGLPLSGHLAELLIQADVGLALWSVLTGMAGLAAATFVGLMLVTASLPALAGGLLIGVGLPYSLLRRRRQKRRDLIAKQLPDALDLIVRSLRAGHPLNAALSTAAREMPDPFGTEAGLAADEIAYGMPLAEAAESMSRRVGLEDLHYVVVAIRIQHGTGGNLADILSALSRVIRARFAMERKIRAISAEGRISGVFLSSTPPAIAGLLALLAPSYFGEVMDDPLFLPMIGVVAALTGLNYLVMRRLLNFRF
jgi:tight adherence protein B